MRNAKPDTMQAAAIDRFGGAELVTVQAVPVPEVGPSDVLIRVEVAGVASWDALEREGRYDGAFGMPSTFPYVLGWDCAGAVVAVGGQVSRFKEGDRVYAASMPLPKGGTYATYAVTDADNVSLIPAKLTIEQAGVMGWDALTALSGLEEIGLKQGDAIMIFGASGGIGHMAIQLAKRLGARVLAVASGDDGVALSQRLGADAIVNGRKDDVVAAAREFAAGGLDAALVTVSSEAADGALTSMRDGGRVACPHGAMPDPKVRPGVELIRYNGARSQDATDKLNRLIDSGPFDVHVARTFPFDRVVDAHRALATHYVGKLALRVS
ncbi:quinone oxidoreductase family protein [Mesorhizobium muleiense]|uniref:quinone oxidoreductase family protein n=2 Tax=Mesorhizobium TaxID=68287 RepID=UPI001F1D7A62|nr:NADP-dependent oxidoreductase [Mesorhizobium muleiense]MCF6113820.1 NADP-dependent oxidoreductase [Mesorhizobium muleiense]